MAGGSNSISGEPDSDEVEQIGIVLRTLRDWFGPHYSEEDYEDAAADIVEALRWRREQLADDAVEYAINHGALPFGHGRFSSSDRPT